jgi:hypothetical protein
MKRSPLILCGLLALVGCGTPEGFASSGQAAPLNGSVDDGSSGTGSSGCDTAVRNPGGNASTGGSTTGGQIAGGATTGGEMTGGGMTGGTGAGGNGNDGGGGTGGSGGAISSGTGGSGGAITGGAGSGGGTTSGGTGGATGAGPRRRSHRLHERASLRRRRDDGGLRWRAEPAPATVRELLRRRGRRTLAGGPERVQLPGPRGAMRARRRHPRLLVLLHLHPRVIASP